MPIEISTIWISGRWCSTGLSLKTCKVKSLSSPFTGYPGHPTHCKNLFHWIGMITSIHWTPLFTLVLLSILQTQTQIQIKFKSLNKASNWLKFQRFTRYCHGAIKNKMVKFKSSKKIGSKFRNNCFTNLIRLFQITMIF